MARVGQVTVISGPEIVVVPGVTGAKVDLTKLTDA